MAIRFHGGVVGPLNNRLFEVHSSVRVSFIAGLGGILYGFDVGIIAAALLFVRNTFHCPRVCRRSS